MCKHFCPCADIFVHVQGFLSVNKLPFQRSKPVTAMFLTKFRYTDSTVWNKPRRGRVPQSGTGLRGDLGTAAASSYLWVGRMSCGAAWNDRVRG